MRPPKLRKTDTLVVEESTACSLLLKAVALRQKYQEPLDSTKLKEAIAQGRTITHRFDRSGIIELLDDAGTNLVSCNVDVGTFAADYGALVGIVSNGHCRTFSHQRLEILQQRFELQVIEQGDMEMREMGRGEMASVDFFKCGKVDNHIHLAAAFNANNFSKYVKEKLTAEGDTVVAIDGGVAKTLSQLFLESGLDERQLGLDAFHILADHSLYQRFDRFNDRYNPWRKSRMRTIFLKSSNASNTRLRLSNLCALLCCCFWICICFDWPHAIGRAAVASYCLPKHAHTTPHALIRRAVDSRAVAGRYFGELTRQLLDRAERKYNASQTTTELRISIYGIDGDEWAKLAAWVLTPWLGAEGRPPRPLLSHTNRWIIQIPRLYSLFRGKRGADGQPQVCHPSAHKGADRTILPPRLHECALYARGASNGCAHARTNVLRRWATSSRCFATSLLHSLRRRCIPTSARSSRLCSTTW